MKTPQDSSESLVYYGGVGYRRSPEIGAYEVKATEIKEFSLLSEARKYYDSLNEEKALWGLNGWPELLECHTIKI